MCTRQVRVGMPYAFRVDSDEVQCVGDVMFATSSEILFANGNELAGNSTDLSGAVEFNDMLVIATSNEFLLTTRDGELIERFEPELHRAINKLGTDGQRIVAMVDDEPFVFDPLFPCCP